MDNTRSTPTPPLGDEQNAPIANPLLVGTSSQDEVNDATKTETARDSGKLAEIGESNHLTQQQQEHKSNEQQKGIQLLQMLQRDYEELQKTSVKGCLRSKQVPCSEVRSLMNDNHLTLSALQQAYETVIEHHDYLGSFQHATKTRSSLRCMTRIGTSIRLIQVLVLWKEDLSETSVMIGGLLQAICSTLGGALKQYNQDSQRPQEEEEDEIDLYCGQISGSFHAPQVACFAFAFLFRIKSLFVEHRIELLSGLWKYLDVLAHGITPHLPQELIGDVVQTLGGYLKEFLQPALDLVTSQLIPEQQLPLSAIKEKTKLCLFFFARLASFLKISTLMSAELDRTVVKDVMNVLVHFCGLATAASASATDPNHSAIATLDPFQKVADRATKCLLALLLLHRKDGATINEVFLPNSSHLRILLQLEGYRQEAALSTEVEQKTLARTTFDVGMAQILLQVLKGTVHTRPAADQNSIPPVWNDEVNVDILLEVSEHMIFVSLPGCNDLFIPSIVDGIRDDSGAMFRLLHEALRQMSILLYQCETLAPCMTSNADRGVVSLHRLLVRWLLPICEAVDYITPKKETQHHPLSRQIVLALVQMHATRLYGFSGDSRDAIASDTPLLDLLVKIFFDPRTKTSHRRTIAALFRNTLTSQSQQLFKRLHYLLCEEYREKRPRLSAKRKRNRKEKVKVKAHGCRDPGWNSFRLEDMRVIGTVLSLLPFSLLPDLASDVDTFFLEKFSSPGKCKRSSKRLKGKSVKTAILCLSLIEAVVREDPSQVALKKLTRGRSLFAFLTDLIAWFLGYWDIEFAKGQRIRAEQERVEILAILGTSILRLIVLSCEQAGTYSENIDDVYRMTQDQIQRVCQFVRACTDESRVLPLCDSSSLAMPSNRVIVAGLLLETSRCLSVIGHVIPLEEPQDILQGIYKIFQGLLGADTCWSLATLTISSLHEFSTTLPRAYKSQLPKCIPKRQRKGLVALLQCRIQRSVYRYELHKRKREVTAVYDNVFEKMQELHAHCASKLGTLICHGQRIAGSTKSRSDSLTIFAGSYFLTMPTQEGRKAVVIFPPGDASLKDINYMLGTGEAEDNDEAKNNDQGVKPCIQQLHRVFVDQDGSCKVVLI